MRTVTASPALPEPARPEPAAPLHPARTPWRFLTRSSLGILVVLATALLSFRLHFNLSSVGSLQLLFIVLIALRWGFRQATIASVIAVGCLNFLFTPPFFHFTVADPTNWIALLTFEATALLVSAVSAQVRTHAARADRQRAHIATLYDLSRAILLLDRRDADPTHLAALIRELVHVDDVVFWYIYRDPALETSLLSTSRRAHETFLAGADLDDLALRESRRILRIGTTPIGAVILRGWDVVPTLADAVASLCALALERARSLEQENRAEAGRHTEQLRTAVLDGLAHAFKTPLTAILTASSGLLAIGSLTPTQTELVDLIDERALALNHLTTRLLQTASLEAREIRLRRSHFPLADLLTDILAAEPASTRSRVHLHLPAAPLDLFGDREMLSVALTQLLDNAAKYARTETPIELRAQQQSGDLIITVLNTGPAIPLAQRELIFERFYRAGDAASGPAGTGLGLSIVRKTAEAHGGRAWVTSDGDHTTFFFSLPLPPEIAHA